MFTSCELEYHFPVRKGENYTGGSLGRQTPADTGCLTRYQERPRARAAGEDPGSL